MIRQLLTLFFLTIAFTSLLNAQLPEKAEDIAPLLVGEHFPNIEVTDLDNQTIDFEDIYKEKPTILIFYRGGWCPYCNQHLSAVGLKEKEILDLGYQVVAVSPDKVENLEATAVKDELKFRLFSDGSGELTKAAGIAFKAPDRYGERLLDWSGGANTGFLPVPSVFIINTQGEILFEYINPNYKKRMSEELLMAVLDALNAEEE